MPALSSNSSVRPRSASFFELARAVPKPAVQAEAREIGAIDDHPAPASSLKSLVRLSRGEIPSCRLAGTITDSTAFARPAART